MQHFPRRRANFQRFKVMKKLQKVQTKEQVIDKVPTLKDTFMDQYGQRIGSIIEIGNVDILVKFGTGNLRSFKFREIEWSKYANCWKFKEPKKEYHVWMEIVLPEGGINKPGIWEKAINIAMSEESANTLQKLLKIENPQMDFSVSIGKPSSYTL